jgi:Flp pilus assembly protein TadG
MRRTNRGITSVEFAVVGALFMVVIFTVIEFGRALFVMNALTESTRRGARLAAVCPVGDPAPANAAAFANGGGGPMVQGLSSSNVQVQYLDVNGAVVANPGGNFSAIRYVSVSITGFTQPLFIPGLPLTVPMTGFTTTLPRESLGVPRAGSITAC